MRWAAEATYFGNTTALDITYVMLGLVVKHGVTANLCSYERQ